ncbi:MAG: transposase, partial [Chloroflexota bacterium]|nr:transposase [Chloroflexota bacterium]
MATCESLWDIYVEHAGTLAASAPCLKLLCRNFGFRYLRAKYGAQFTAVTVGTGIEVLRTPIKAPRANAICERLLGRVRRECLDHILIVSEAHLRGILNEYVEFFNRSRPHQGIHQHVP